MFFKTKILGSVPLGKEDVGFLMEKDLITLIQPVEDCLCSELEFGVVYHFSRWIPEYDVNRINPKKLKEKYLTFLEAKKFKCEDDDEGWIFLAKWFTRVHQAINMSKEVKNSGRYIFEVVCGNCEKKFAFESCSTEEGVPCDTYGDIYSIFSCPCCGQINTFPRK